MHSRSGCSITHYPLVPQHITSSKFIPWVSAPLGELIHSRTPPQDGSRHQRKCFLILSLLSRLAIVKNGRYAPRFYTCLASCLIKGSLILRKSLRNKRPKKGGLESSHRLEAAKSKITHSAALVQRSFWL